MKRIQTNLLKIGIIIIGFLLFLLPVSSFAWNGYPFYCYSDADCQTILGPGYMNHTQDPYGVGDRYKSIAGVWHSMHKNGSAWLDSEPIYGDGYRPEGAAYGAGSWGGASGQIVNNVGGMCIRTWKRRRRHWISN